jgi:signal transduction histidine kinase
VDLAEPVADELEQIQGAHPDRRIGLAVSGDLRGWWDGRRLQQLLRNLVVNALRHGAPESDVRVVLNGAEADVTLAILNSGTPVDPAVLSRLSDPRWRGAPQGSKASRTGLGLGLFIVREIARGHGGDVAVCSEGGETAFTIRLPRRQPDRSSIVTT